MKPFQHNIKVLLFLALGLCTTFGFGQTVISTEDFDGGLPNWTNDISSQTFVDPTTQPPDPLQGFFIQTFTYIGSNNTAFGKDMEGESGEPTLSPYVFTFNSLDVSAYNNVELSFDYYVTSISDQGSYEVIIDGISQGAIDFYNSGATREINQGTISVFIGSATTVELILEGTLNGSNDELELDNFVIEGIPNGPFIQVSDNSINNLDYTFGNGPSAEDSFEISGSGLTNNVVITAPTNFEISNTSGSGYTNSLTLSPVSGNLSPTIIYIRLVAGLALNTYNGTLSVTSDAAPQNINLSGQVTNPTGGGNICGIDIDFETAGGYSTSIPEDIDETTDYFGRIEYNVDTPNAIFTNVSGNFYFGAQDIDGITSNPSVPVELNISNIDISMLSDLEFSVDLAEDLSNTTWDNDDYVHFYYSIDGNPEQNLLWIENDGSQFNTLPLIDTNFDGIGDGASLSQNFTTFVQSINETGSQIDLRVEFKLDSGGEDIAIDNISICGIDSSIDNDSVINQPISQISSGTIIADQTTLFSNAVPIFRFQVQDIGTADGLDTIIEEFRIVPGSSNTTSWSQVIQGVEVIAEGSGGQVDNIDQNVIISDTEIIIQILNTPQNEMTTADGDTREYTIGVYLNETGITDQQIVQFAIPASSSGWETENNSSQFVSSFTSFEGNPFTIDVVGNGLEFLTDATNALTNQAMNAVSVANTDVNSNIDLSLVNDVEIISTGTLSVSPISVTPVNGISIFSSIIHTQAGSNLNLTANSSGLSSIMSASFDIIDNIELFISEVTDPSDDFEGRYIELFNSGVDDFDFSSTVLFLVRERGSVGGGDVFEIQLNGVVPPKGYFIIGRNSGFFDNYGFSPDQLEVNAGGTVAGNGDDSYFLSLNNDSDAILKSSAVDVYGEIGTDGTSTDWEYLDSRAYRNNPTVREANSNWQVTEWNISFPTSAAVVDMTPGYGDNDYIYLDDTDGWSSIGLGNPIGSSTTSRNIFVRGGSTTLTGDISVGDLVVRSGATLTLAPDVRLTVNGDIVNEGTIIFDSNSSGTAVLEALQPTSRVVGNGFETRRFVPSSNRAFRYLGSSVTTSTSIRDNWQEGQNNMTTSSNSDTNPGFGTHITGSTTGNNGFDATITGNASLYNFNVATQAWASLPNTDTETLSVGDAFAFLIRGDRSTTLDSNSALGNPTTLRTTGQIHSGDFSVNSSQLTSTIGQFNLIGNPYQSQVDLNQLLNGSNASGLHDQFIHVYDPSLGTIGGYATVDLSINNVTNTTQGVPADSDANQFLQPNQAFFVETTSASPQLTFSEVDKDNSSNQTDVFIENGQNYATLDISLKDDSNKTYDGVRIVYDQSYSSVVNTNDATNFWNFTDNLSLHKSDAHLSIEKRGIPHEDEFTQLFLSQHSLTNYTLEFLYKNENGTGIEVYLTDQYTSESLLLSPNTITSYSFEVDQNIPSSVSPDRFIIQYDSSTLSTQDFSTVNDFRIFPNPLSNTRILSVEMKTENINDVFSIELFTIHGKLVKRIKKDELLRFQNSKSLYIDNHIVNGSYILVLNTNQKKYISKLIIN